jgi:hypothetical protein
MSFRRIVCGALLICLAVALAKPAVRAQASAQAPPSSSSSSPKPARKTASASPLDSGTVSSGIYRNPAFGFTCKIPPAWVLRTEEMNARDDDDAKIDAGKIDAGKKSTDAGRTGRVLLAAFSRPPAAHGEDINASILIAAESAAAYPGLKDAAQYFGPVTEVAKAQGFEVDEEPYEFVLGTKTVVRGDFEKDVGTRVMQQSTLVVLARGYAVSFTFIGGTEDEVEELVQGLSFAANGKAVK